MKTNALEYLKHQHCQFRLSEHILSSAYPVIAQIMEEYVELSTNQANGAKQSTSNCNIPHVVGQSEQLNCGRNITTCVFYKGAGKCSNLEYCRDQTT